MTASRISFAGLARGLVLSAALVLAACSQEEPVPEGLELEPVTFATDWVAQAEHGGFYQAVALGLYEERGLDVTIRPGGAGANIPQLLASGAVEFGMGSNSFIPLNLVRAGVPARAVMAAFQKDPQVLITHPREDIQSLEDMQGKPIMISDATRTAWWPWLEARFGFEESQIRRYSGNVAPFLVDPQAIQQGYITSEPYLIERELGEAPHVYLLADHGYPSYATLVIAMQSMIDERPELVEAFVQASIEGWRSYLEGDPSAAHALIKRDNPDMSDELLSQARQKLIDFAIVFPPDTADYDIGAMTHERWHNFFTLMATAGIYEADLDYSKAYTQEFIYMPGDLSPETE